MCGNGSVRIAVLLLATPEESPSNGWLGPVLTFTLLQAERRMVPRRSQLCKEWTLLRSICCLFGGRCEDEPKATVERPGAADLGQEEAELEKTGKEQMSHMKGEASGKTTRQRR